MIKHYLLLAPESGEGGGGSGGDDPLAAARARGDVLEDDHEDLEDDTPDTKAADKAADVKAKVDDADLDELEDSKPKPKDEPKPKVEKKPQMIPKQRFDEVLQRLRDLEKTVGKEEKAPPTLVEKVSALETEAKKLLDEHTKALDKGDVAKAGELMLKLRETDREIARLEARATAAQERAIAVEQVRFDMLIEQLEDKYPQLKEGSDEFDEDLVTEINDMRAAWEARGYSSSDALKKAVKYVLRDDAPKAQVEKDVDKAAEKADKEADKVDKAAERKAEAVKRNLKAAGKQPADLNNAPGVDSDKKGGGVDLKSIKTMTEDEIAALPESTKRKLRGDFYEPTV